MAQETKSMSKISQWIVSSTNDILHTHSEIKQQNTLSLKPIKNSNNLLQTCTHRNENDAHYNNNKQSSIVTINIAGIRFQTYATTLSSYPETLLGNEIKRNRYWNSNTCEYFFDRNRACFESILCYYQSNGCLRRPEHIPLDTFLEEITFFELGSQAIEQVYRTEKITKIENVRLPKLFWRRLIWFYLEYPQYSLIGRLLNMISIVATIVSSVSLAIESLPQYADRWDSICRKQTNISSDLNYVPLCSAILRSPFFIIQTTCVGYFTIEFLLRFVSTPSYYQFLFSLSNCLDLVTTVPYYIFLSIQIAETEFGLDSSALMSIRLLKILQFSRIFKISLVIRRLPSLQTLGATIKESIVDFSIMITIITILAFVFGTAIYFTESQSNRTVFDSIPKSIYWAIITMTGVGYGDMYPATVGGRIITCICALSGSATMAMLVSVLVDRYQRVYQRKMYLSESENSSNDFHFNTSTETKHFLAEHPPLLSEDDIQLH